jgi:hypothetical protein
MGAAVRGCGGARVRRPLVGVLLVMVLALPAAAQFRRQPPQRQTITAEYDSHYVFTRIRYNNSGRGLARGFFGGGGWEHDYPTADRNLTAIVDYITNARVRVDASNILDLDDPRIFDNPIIYMSEPGFWTTHEEEAKSLRDYLLKGGFIIFDDFEGEGDMRNLRAQMKQALPDHDFIRLDVSSPVFQSFFGIRHLEVPHPNYDGPPAFYGMFEKNDPAGRLIAIANFNNDLGDYWEWSAEGLYGSDPTNDAYRLGVNYIVYAMTH